MVRSRFVVLLAVLLVILASKAAAIGAPAPVPPPSHGAEPVATALAAAAQNESAPYRLQVEPVGAVARAAGAVRGLAQVITVVATILGLYVLFLLAFVGLGAVAVSRERGTAALEGLAGRVERRPLATLICGLVVIALVAALAKVLGAMHLGAVGLILAAVAILGATSGPIARAWSLGSERLLGGEPRLPVPRLVAGSALFLAACLTPIAGQVLLVGVCLQGLGAWTMQEVSRFSAGEGHAMPASPMPPPPTPAPTPPPAAS